MSAIGAATLKKAATRAETPFAAIPLLFGVQQVIEGIVWVSFGSPYLNAAMTFAYSLFSHVLWPIFVPFSVLLMEGAGRRKKAITGFLLIGVSVGTYLLYFMVTEPIVARIVNDSIAYDSPHFYPLATIALYLLATCGSSLLSSHRLVNLFGAFTLISFAVASWLFAATFISVWCFFAAILSATVYLHLKYGKR